jgi:hypothetical protein
VCIFYFKQWNTCITGLFYLHQPLQYSLPFGAKHNI